MSDASRPGHFFPGLWLAQQGYKLLQSTYVLLLIKNIERYFSILHRTSAVSAFPTVVGASTAPPARSLALLCFAVDGRPTLLLLRRSYRLLRRSPRLTVQAPPRPCCSRQLATEVIVRVLAPDDTDRRRQLKEKRRALARKPFGLASCYGCGAPMQMSEEIQCMF
jgi:hypothetical protein